MITTDEEALRCDLAEVYHIYDYESLPASLVATFSVGLREDSRIKLKMNNTKYRLETILLASVVDRLSLLVWMQTEDGRKGSNRPQSLAEQLLSTEEKETVGFDTPEEFEDEWKRITERGE